MDSLFDQAPEGPQPDDEQRNRPRLAGRSGPDAAPDGRPLAARMRPRSLDEFVGQAHLLGEGSALRSAIEHGRPHSMVLYGPPGSGKTTLARLVAERSQAAFEELSAVAGGARGGARGDRARRAPALAGRERCRGRPTVLFLDEIHRFNKAQQDALLPAVEEGLLTLIGATTENPAFEVNGALLSRMRVYALQALSAGDVAELLRRAAQARQPTTTRSSSSRRAAKATRARRSTRWSWPPRRPPERGEQRVTLARVEDALQRRAVLYDKAGDRHYDYASAWIKATRGSDPDASLYYLAVMLEGGEDPRFIVRRMVILASEDIGNADPQALLVATAAAAAVEHVGLPEARYALAQAAIYLALAPKSDAAGRALGGRAAPRARARRASRAGLAALRAAARPGQWRLRQPARPRRPPVAAAAAARAVSTASASTSPTRPRRELDRAPARDSQGAWCRAAIIAGHEHDLQPAGRVSATASEPAE